MKWPGRLACRRPITSGVPARCRNPICGQWLAQLVAVLALERRAAHHAAVGVLGQPLPDRVQPRVAVVVVERVPGRHLGDVGRRVEVVGVGERHAQPLRERRADGRLPRTGHAHDDDW